jgi:peptidoglycan/xylan/chitin deacetylase (PgdA/CDA1 family)
MRFRLPRRGIRAARRSTKSLGLALLYHRIGKPAGDPRYELVPALDTDIFEAQLDHLRENYRVVPPSRLTEATFERRPGDPFPVAITFDDDLSSHVDVAAPALRRAGLPAGFFLCGASLEGPHRFWWEDLQRLADYASPDTGLDIGQGFDLTSLARGVPGVIHQIAERIEQLPAQQRDEVAAELRKHAGQEQEQLDANAVRALAAEFEIGFHTRRHYLLTTLDDVALRTALSEGLAELETTAGRRLTMLAYPHGKADRRVAESARNAGFELAFTGFPVPLTARTDLLRVGRIDASSISPSGFGRVIRDTLMHEPC